MPLLTHEMARQPRNSNLPDVQHKWVSQYDCMMVIYYQLSSHTRLLVF